MAETKICASCNVEKPKSEFHKRMSRSCGVQSKCKPCMAEYKKYRYWSNHEAELEKLTKSRLKPENVLQRKGYYQQNKEQYRERHNKYWADEIKRNQKLERSKISYQNNIDKVKVRHRRNYEKPEVKARIRQRHHERKTKDLQYIITRRLRFRVRHLVKGCKSASTIAMLGCDLAFFKNYLENLFTEGMTWELLLKGEIHIDHKKPCATFDLTKPEEQNICFHYTNLQPLWKIDNLKKGDKYEH
jgi:hypothetical protein